MLINSERSEFFRRLYRGSFNIQGDNNRVMSAT